MTVEKGHYTHIAWFPINLIVTVLFHLQFFLKKLRKNYSTKENYILCTTLSVESLFSLFAIPGCSETTGITVETAKEILADAGEKECEDGEGRKTKMNQEGIDKRSLDGELRSVALLIRVSQYQWNSKLAFFLLDQ